MYPVLIRIGPLTLSTYGVMFASGTLLAILLAFRKAKREGLDLNVFADFIFWTLLTGILGAKLLLVLTDLRFYIARPGELRYVLTTAGVFYGGLIASALFAVWYIRRKRLSYRQLSDIIAPSLVLGHAFGRLGCFSAGCCWGRAASDCSLAVTFTNPEAYNRTGVPLGIPLYPTQLAEAILNLFVFVFLTWLYRHRRFRGQVFAAYLFIYSLLRFGMEYFRGDSDRGYLFGGIDHPLTSISTSQAISLLGLLVAPLLYLLFRKKGEKENPL
jgi:phosphatidylglycerol---prolipoprotein diacylglyceryl transferase